MLNPFKKRRIIRELYKEGRQFVADSRSGGEGEVCIDRNAKLDERLTHMEKLLDKLAPFAPLGCLSVFARIGMALIVFLMLMVPLYLALKDRYLASSLSNYAQGVGNQVVTQFVPESPIEITDFSLIQKQDFAGPVTLESSTDTKGIVVGIVPEGTGMSVLWTELEDGKHILRRGVLNSRLRLTSTSTLWGDVDLLGAAVTVKNGTRVVGTALIQGKPRILAQAFTSDWKAIGQRVSIPMDVKDESLEGIQLSDWQGQSVILTERIPPAGSSVLDLKQTVMRMLDSKLQVIWNQTLPVGSMNTDAFASFEGATTGSREFVVYTNGRPPLQSPKEIRGDELYAIHFNNLASPTSYQRITSNGRPNDFWPSGFYNDEKSGLRFLAAHQIQAPGFSTPKFPAGYPKNSGRSLIYVFDAKFKLIGTLIAYEGSAQDATGSQAGATHTRIFRNGRRLYIAYDLLSTNDAASEPLTRSVQVMTMDLSR